MEERLDIFDENGNKIGDISKKQYYNGALEEIPWIKLCTCFVIDSKTGKILFEKRGKVEIDPGKLDLCSGHVRSGEISHQTMVRELKEELNIPESVARNIKLLQEIQMDYTSFQDEKNRNRLKAFISIFALKVQDINQVKKDSVEVENINWFSYEESVNHIINGETRFPYEESISDLYEKVFLKLKGLIYPEKIDNEKNMNRGNEDI